MPTTFRHLTEIHLATLHAIRDMDRAGVYPSGDRLVAALEDYPEDGVRRARHELVAGGLAAVRTPNDGPDAPEPDCEGVVLSAADVPASRPGGLAVDASSRAWNVALYRVVHGHKGLYAHLSELTGLSVNALKSRVKRVHFEYPPDEVDDPAAEDEEINRYLAIQYRNCKDPAVRDWRISHPSAPRAHPDRSRCRHADSA